VDSVKDALVVPAQAVIEREDKQFIYLNDDSRARLREVTTGLSSWTSTQVVSGLKEGDEVIVTTDVPGLKEGKRVEAEPL
jgi:hypothetical protein